ncbi:MAG: hypothetical protein V3R95_00625 [Dehalococcoidia bacterium]
MAWVRTVQPGDAEGEILEGYRKIFGEHPPARAANVVASTSIRPRTMSAMLALNDAVDFENSDSGLSRLQLEMIATVVSATQKCRY